MLRTLVRTSRWLARRRINNSTPAILREYTRIRAANTLGLDIREFSSNPSHLPESADHIQPAVFEEVCNETLESLCDYFEEVLDEATYLKGADVTFSDGVLTVSLGSHGTYVINRQTPNKQIWLSSPVSGPKRYDLVLKNGGYWVYKHDGVTLHKLLQDELSKIFKNIDFKKCAHSVFK